MSLRFEELARDGEARKGRITTPRGSFITPCFMPVGTRAAVRTLDTADLEALDPPVVLANTYHLMMRPGPDVIQRLGGIHGFTGWSGHMLTDSGGYQVFSLDPRVDDEGVTFRSTYDGSTHRFTAEQVVEVQLRFGSDIQMVLDVCPPADAPAKAQRRAVDRTSAWAVRARRRFLERSQDLPASAQFAPASAQEYPASAQFGPASTQDCSASAQFGIVSTQDYSASAQFGIVQGGTDPALRVESAARTVEIGFEGYAVGGLSVGEQQHRMLAALAATVPHLPRDRPRYFMGLGDPVGLLESVALGVDMFDCVLPTRLARHGTALTWQGRLNITNASFATDERPIDPDFPTAPTARYSRAYLRHLFNVDEPSAARLLTLHNVAWLLALMEATQDAITTGTLSRLRRRVAESWTRPAESPPSRAFR